MISSSLSHILACIYNIGNTFTQMAKKMKKIGQKAQKAMNKDGRRGEADRHVYDLKPKHLFSGKRGLGSSNKR